MDLTKSPSGKTQAYNADDEVCWSATSSASCSSPPTGATTYTYSNEGNRTATTPSSGTSDTYGWTESNQLKSVTPSSGSATTYSSDGNGLLQGDTTGSSTTHFTWNPQPSLPLMLSDGTNYYIYGNGTDPFEQIAVSGGATSYLLSDHLGSTRAITNSSGTVTATASYDAWGNLTGTTGTATTRFLYAGEYLDSASGFYYFRARWYDPATGEFTSLDPEVAQTSQPFEYAIDDPVNNSDPSGDYPYYVDVRTQGNAGVAWAQVDAQGSGRVRVSFGFNSLPFYANLVGYSVTTISSGWSLNYKWGLQTLAFDQSWQIGFTFYVGRSANVTTEVHIGVWGIYWWGWPTSANSALPTVWSSTPPT
jgi:RHS repeat-associated protein